MKEDEKKEHSSIITSVLTVGAVWGIFEATVGYLLHLLPIKIGFLVWYPASVFFLMAVYKMTGKRSALLWTAALAASIKLLNLMLPGSVDRVINPAVSILFEGLAVFTAIYFLRHKKWGLKPLKLLLISIGMNTFWRGLYLLYIAFLVPGFMREVSVLQSGAKLMSFIVTDNLWSSLIVFCGMLAFIWLKKHGKNPLKVNLKPAGFMRFALPAILLVINITLQMTL